MIIHTHGPPSWVIFLRSESIQTVIESLKGVICRDWISPKEKNIPVLFSLFCQLIKKKMIKKKPLMPLVQFITGNFMAEKCFQFIMAVISDIGLKLKETSFLFYQESVRNRRGM